VPSSREAGQAESLQILLSGITRAGCRLPDLGVFVGLNELILDYRMGPDWGHPQIEGLMALLRDLRAMGRRDDAAADTAVGAEGFDVAGVEHRF